MTREKKVKTISKALKTLSILTLLILLAPVNPAQAEQLRKLEIEPPAHRVGTYLYHTKAPIADKKVSLEKFSETIIPSFTIKSGIEMSPESMRRIFDTFEANGGELSLMEAMRLLMTTPEYQRAHVKTPEINLENLVSKLLEETKIASKESCNVGEMNGDTKGQANYYRLLTLYNALETRGLETLPPNANGGSWHLGLSVASLQHPDVSDAQVETWKDRVRDGLAELREICGNEVAGTSTAGPDDGNRAGNSIIPFGRQNRATGTGSLVQ